MLDCRGREGNQGAPERNRKWTCGEIWDDGKEGVSPRQLQRNCMGGFATQEATERKLRDKHFLCKDTMETGENFF